MKERPNSNNKRQDALIARAIARAAAASIDIDTPPLGAPGATIAPGSTVNAPRAQVTTQWVDVTGAAVNLGSPGPGPVDGDLWIIKPVGTTFANPILLNGTGGATIESKTAPSSFGASAVLTSEGGSLIYQFQAAGNRWGIVGLLGNL
jgi:hypothetical protein